jgi:hypothetical protein
MRCNILDRAILAILWFLLILLPLAIIINTADATIIKPVLLFGGVYLLLLLWLLASVLTSQVELAKNPLNPPVIAFLAVILLSFLFSKYRFVSQRGLLWILPFFILFFIGSQKIRGERRIKGTVYLLLGTTFLASLFGLFQHFGFRVFPWQEENLTRIPSTFGNANFFAGFLAGILPLNIALVLGERERLKRLIFVALSLLFLSSLALALTRTAWFAFLGGGLALWLSHRKRGEFGLRYLLLLLIFLALFFSSPLRPSWRGWKRCFISGGSPAFRPGFRDG